MTIKVVHIGVGGRGRHWLDFVAQHPDFAAVACVDIDEKALESARRAPGQEHGTFCKSLQDALARTQADAVLITSPSFLHSKHALEALDAGLAVMVEKPFGCNLAEAQTVVDRAGAVGRPVMVAENFRFFQAERTLRHMLDEGAVGRIAAAVCVDRRDQPSHTQGPWVKSMAHPFLREIAVHHFDSFRYLFNRQPVAIFAASYSPPGSDYDEHAAVNAVIEFDEGLPIQYSGTLVANRFGYNLWVQGDRGDIWTNRRWVWWRPKGQRFFRPVRLVPVPKGDEQRYPKAGTVSLLNQFRDAVIEGKTAETNGEDNLWTLAMVEAGILSVHERRKVQLSEVFTAPGEKPGGTGSKSGMVSGAEASVAAEQTAPFHDWSGCRRYGFNRKVVSRGSSSQYLKNEISGNMGAYADHGRSRSCFRLAFDIHGRSARRAWALSCIRHAARPTKPGATAPRSKSGSFLVEDIKRSGQALHRHGRVLDLPAAELQRSPNCRVGHLDLVFRAVDHSRIGQTRNA